MSVDQKRLDEVKAVQRANSSMTFDQAWTIVEARRTALPCDLGAATRAMQVAHPGLNFEECWDLVEAEALPFLRKGETVGQALIRARQQTVVRSLRAPFEVKAQTTVRSFEDDEPWPKGKMLLICGSEGVYV